jgi:ectoine hydroxylase-related dioxygenase (phytanoyl-CoA dioxygenase family)
LIRNTFVLNQQNGVVNPPRADYEQGAWHRDLPYQHFVVSRPIAVNALYCVDEFTLENGATAVIPASHHREDFPSEPFVERHTVQISAPAGSFVLMNAMLFHRGGPNRTETPRRAVNHLYTSAFLKQQIDIPAALGGRAPERPGAADLLGFRYQMPRNVSEFLSARARARG